jgi:hypothetical protein
LPYINIGKKSKINCMAEYVITAEEIARTYGIILGTYITDFRASESVYENQYAVITGKLMQDNPWPIPDTPKVGKEVTLFVDGVEFRKGRTDGNGIFRFSVLGSDLGVGSHRVYVYYPGSWLVQKDCKSTEAVVTVKPGEGKPGEVPEKPVIDWKLIAMVVAGTVPLILVGVMLLREVSK